MSSIVSLALIARQARAAAARGDCANANPYPPLDPAHAVWAECHAQARASVGQLIAWPPLPGAHSLADVEAAHA